VNYRVANNGYHYPEIVQDAIRAVRWVRANAATFRIDPGKIGVMGSSAGGHLASLLVTRADVAEAASADPVDRQSSHPDFGILCYAVITMSDQHTDLASRVALLGRNPAQETVILLSAECQVTAKTSPCFIWQTLDDPTVDVENAFDFAAALRKAGVPFDLHVYAHGTHGLGIGDGPPFANPLPWTKDMVNWLKTVGMSLKESPLSNKPESSAVDALRKDESGGTDGARKEQ
jgi:acetyl esterase/lipase